MLIAQITDLHLGLSGGYAGDHNGARLARVLDALVALAPRPDLLLVTGDLVENGDLASYRQLHAALSGL
ncbi:metallophosphoesterase, partial [Acinetobacter baumannii]